MYQQSFSFPLVKSRLWLIGFAFIIALLIAQGAAAIGPFRPVIYFYIPPQQADMDGDGQLEPVEGDFAVYEDGSADGRFLIARDLTLEQTSGEVLCESGNPVGHTRGTLYQEQDGQQVELGILSMEIHQDSSRQKLLILITDGVPAGNDPTGPIWDIIDNDVSEVEGTMGFKANPCA